MDRGSGVWMVDFLRKIVLIQIEVDQFILRGWFVSCRCKLFVVEFGTDIFVEVYVL